MFVFTALLGAQAQSAAVQSLLELDGGVKILVDVGWDDSFDANLLQRIEQHASSISLILLTHPTFAHLGAYAHCCKHIPLFSRIPVYATTPVIALGRALLHDVYASAPLASAILPSAAFADLAYSLGAPESGEQANILLPPPSADDISEYFNAINPLKFSQQHQPSPSPSSPPLDGLTITAHSAGHSLGGTIWHIQHGSESIVYAVDWNQARENVLAGAAWLGGATAPGSEIIEPLRQPSALVCSAKRCDVRGPEGGWKTRDETLLGHVRHTIQQGGSVLIPCDSSSRVLELAFLLEQAWVDDRNLQKTPLYMASHTAGAVMRYARSMLEWMDESVVREFESNAANKSAQAALKQGAQPFDFKFLKLLEKKSKVVRAMSAEGPKVFLASDTTLEWGYSRTVIESMSGDTRNLVILPDQNSKDAQEGSVLAKIKEIIGTGEAIHEIDQTFQARSVDLQPLEATELPYYQQYLARQRQKQTAIGVDRDTAIETAADAMDDQSSSSSSSEDSDTELQGKALNTFASMTNNAKQRLGVSDEELGINILLRRKMIHDYDVRGKRGRERIYPYVAKRKRNDDYGDAIRPDEYLRAEEREDPAAQDPRSGSRKDDLNLGQKRKFDREDPSDMTSKRRRGTTQVSKGDMVMSDGKINGGGGGELENESEDSDYEPEEGTIQGPRKAVLGTSELQLKLKIVAVDYVGIHDERSLNMLIPLIKPRKLVLTAGTAHETWVLKSECERMLAASSKSSRASEVFAPQVLDAVDASVDTDAWSIKLSPALMRTLAWQQVRGLGLVTVSGQVGVDETAKREEGNKRQKREGDGAKESSKETAVPVPVLAVLPAHLLATERSFAQSVHVGDLRLAELRKVLQGQRHTAEFKGEGTLLVDGTVAVRKNGVGRIEIENSSTAAGAAATGRADAAFDVVRQRVYDGLAVVAAR